MIEIPPVWRTYLMGAGIIIHQGLKLIGFDVPDTLLSDSIDAILGIGAIFFRWRGVVAAKAAIAAAGMGVK